MVILDPSPNISSAMVIENPPQEWLWRWLQIEFYKDKCEKHVHKYKTVFCCECMEEPVCESCWKESIEEHKDHPHLQVFAASRRASVEIKDIKKLLDVSYIQQYKINGKDIIYLNPNYVGGAVNKKNVGGAGEPKSNPECDICTRKLIDSKYIFCSIACKNTCAEWYVQTREHINARRLEPTPIELPPEPTPIELPPEPTPTTGQISFRKRSRKGIPRRAPLK